MDDRLEVWLAERRRRWVVTGAAGFIGSHLVEELLRRGQDVVGIDDFSTGLASNLAEVGRAVGPEAYARFTLVDGDVRDPAVLMWAFRGGDVVLHQAARTSVPRSFDDPAATLEVNIVGTRRVVKVAARRGATALVLASSSSVYGTSPVLPRREGEVGEPTSPYAQSKQAAEAALRHVELDLPVVGLRYFNVFGPRQRADGPYAPVVPRWITELSLGRTPPVFGGVGRTRDFTPVANVVRANLLAAWKATAGEPRFFNVGLGEQRSLGVLFEAIRDRLVARGYRCPAEELEPGPARSGDPEHGWADLTLAREQLGYVPIESFDAGLERTLDALAPRRNSA